MTYWYASKYSKHKDNYNNPLMFRRKLWELKLVHYSYKSTRRVSSCGKYNIIRKYRKNRNKWRNPLLQTMWSREQEKIWGRFDR